MTSRSNPRVSLLVVVIFHCSILSTVSTLSPLFFFFKDTPPTEIYTLSLHDALPISPTIRGSSASEAAVTARSPRASDAARSEEHTSELQSRLHLVCRLLLEKKKKKKR